MGRGKVLDVRTHLGVWLARLVLIVRSVLVWLTSDYWGLTWLEWVGVGIVLFAIGCGEVVTVYSWTMRGK